MHQHPSLDQLQDYESRSFVGASPAFSHTSSVLAHSAAPSPYLNLHPNQHQSSQSQLHALQSSQYTNNSSSSSSSHNLSSSSSTGALFSGYGGGASFSQPHQSSLAASASSASLRGLSHSQFGPSSAPLSTPLPPSSLHQQQQQSPLKTSAHTTYHHAVGLAADDDTAAFAAALRTTSSKAVLSAMHALQAKIRRLEAERADQGAEIERMRAQLAALNDAHHTVTRERDEAAHALAAVRAEAEAAGEAARRADSERAAVQTALAAVQETVARHQNSCVQYFACLCGVMCLYCFML